MRLINQIAIGKDCTVAGGCGIRITDFDKAQIPTGNYNRPLKPPYIENFHAEMKRLIKSDRDFYFIIRGTVFLSYGSSPPIPVSSPYNSTDFVDYVNNWNYDEDFIGKTTDHAYFLYVRVLDEISENLKVKIAVLNPGITHKSIESNCRFLVIKPLNSSCEVDGVSYTDPRNAIIEIDNSIAKDVTFNVSEQSHLICFQS